MFSGVNGAGASAQSPGQSGSFLGSLGVATQPPPQTTFKGKGHTLGDARSNFFIACASISNSSAATAPSCPDYDVFLAHMIQH